MIEKKQQFWSLLLVIIIIFAIIFHKNFLPKILAKSYLKENPDIALEMFAKSMDEPHYAVGDMAVFEKVSLIKEERTVILEYRFLYHSKDDFDLVAFRADIAEGFIEDIGSSKELAILRNNNIIFEFVYFDNQNEEMFKIRLLLNTPVTVIN
ncbi:MAG: hypothetical protein FWD87_01200 [Spirochaetaceae bacterium]|nr:hypothetical protein [Spirochaetaceae bacterium]